MNRLPSIQSDKGSGAYSFTFASALRAPAARVWAHASSFAGVNRELWPLARMTYTASQALLTPETTPVGRPAFRSWILAFGIIPVDYDDITLVELEPGRGFHEVSRMISAREWRHRRTILPTAEGCVVHDEVTFVPRWRWAGPVMVWVFRLVFANRHRALRRLFGGACSAIPPP
jgi:ligand-binding SRPBCC domain-containing protein